MFFISKAHLGGTVCLLQLPVTSVLLAWHSFRWMFTLWLNILGTWREFFYPRCSNLMVLLKTAGCVCCFLSCLNFCTAAGSFVFDQHHELKLKNTQTWDEYRIMETWTGSSLEEIVWNTHSFWFFLLEWQFETHWRKNFLFTPSKKWGKKLNRNP